VNAHGSFQTNNPNAILQDGETVTVELFHECQQWEFPQERFVTYEESDERWCRFFGIGKDVVVVRKTTIPNAVIRYIGDGEFEFEATNGRQSSAT
jgi:hypothetical protein